MDLLWWWDWKMRQRIPDDASASGTPMVESKVPDLIWPACMQASERAPIVRHLSRVRRKIDRSCWTRWR
ncbi:hypothetical protein BN2476_500104 [Paraburkholderia piptadeniae]|uniref:Uncharacterized protein n=1 Tax=Paraburkholderia piptadeniae TaxID=1701573 RepID=A0A1N7SFV3_9BURK|nr:hypothetical protein BN2476_500104 [Paraburkholderia piptadeniae]